MIKSGRKKKIEVGGYVETKVEKSKVENIYETLLRCFQTGSKGSRFTA